MEKLKKISDAKKTSLQETFDQEKSDSNKQ